ncbi:MAG TPA: hypothetical protein VMS60_00200 [Solirubrobacterales bacterium]|nr:hypothetical protein [Solirubrobacterales bacterium]
MSLAVLTSQEIGEIQVSAGHEHVDQVTRPRGSLSPADETFPQDRLDPLSRSEDEPITSAPFDHQPQDLDPLNHAVSTYCSQPLSNYMVWMGMASGLEGPAQKIQRPIGVELTGGEPPGKSGQLVSIGPTFNRL